MLLSRSLALVQFILLLAMMPLPFLAYRASRRERTKQRLYFILAMGLAFVSVVCAFWMLLAVRQSSRGNDVSFYLGLALPAISLVVAAITVRRTLDRGRRLHRSRVLDFADTQFPTDHR